MALTPPESWSSAKAWREFFDTLTDAVVVLDLRARVVFANTAALRLLPFDVGMPLTQLQGALGAAALRW
ncbi:MAG: PAS domain-containing protein, partial [Caldimonas sp.]